MKAVHLELLHTSYESGKQFLLWSLVIMHGCINKMDSFRIDCFPEGFYTPVGQVGIDRQVMTPTELLAQINESRINGGFAPAHVQ